ncbi:MAG: DUF2344 domain-containing protein [Provencibacterium sp.]|jgi:radical SAM-linked protein|nr:DUF2344 domain-containing protein [Provencibacterium sp.]
MMIDTRVFYEKRGRIRYISHLDMNRLMQRALARAKLPVWFTQGFNPHLYLTFPLPLSLGFESKSEMMDIRLTEQLPADEVKARLNAQLPEGLFVSEVAPPQLPAAQIAFCDYEITLPGSVSAQLEAFLAAPVVVEKKTKKGSSEMDIRPHLKLLGLREESGKTILLLRCASGPVFNVNPSLAMEAFCREYGHEAPDVDYLKTAVLTAQGERFR